ncbi:MAG: glutamate racemase, partial [Proteobacteria bacterium]|nr:glutamate racemase [Pseudomonadota bacterium]
MTAKKTMIDALIFDSGVGGLSILSEILRLRPKLSYAYIADTAGLPYGDKSDAWLLQRVSAVLALVLRQFEPGIVVIACNTASTLVLQDIRAQVSIPVVGVVPAIKPAAALSRSHVIGLLATPATVQRPYIDQLIQDFAGNCQVIRLGNSRLVELAEQKLRGETFSIDEIRDIVQIFRLAEPQPDTLVLGCTHFPLLQSELQ